MTIKPEIIFARIPDSGFVAARVSDVPGNLLGGNSSRSKTTPTTTATADSDWVEVSL